MVLRSCPALSIRKRVISMLTVLRQQPILIGMSFLAMAQRYPPNQVMFYPHDEYGYNCIVEIEEHGNDDCDEDRAEDSDDALQADDGEDHEEWKDCEDGEDYEETNFCGEL
ncbi:hypothetical protein BDR05DRAFT_487492 [Suillus weaverae]|nr:hypothetical protein BDR05DRAFT_487492 [Suillus weaverae]